MLGLWLLPITGLGQEEADYYWATNEDETITITGYGGTNLDVVIPTNLDGRLVTGIGHMAFYWHTGLRRIEIPDSILRIDSYAFGHCWSLTDIAIPDSVTNLEAAICADCSSLTNATIGVGVRNLPEFVFADCRLLSTAWLGENINLVGKRVFGGCSNLTVVYFKGNAPEIEEPDADVFYHAEQAVIYYFSGTTGWEDAWQGRPTVPYQPAQDIAVYTWTTNVDRKLSLTGYSGPGGELELPGSIEARPVSSIANMAFYAKSNVTQIVIPVTVTNIGGWAFASCSSMTNAAIGSHVADIAEHAFHGCANLRRVYLPASVKQVGESAFWGCSALTNIVLGSGVVSLAQGAFCACSNVHHITIPSNVVEIGVFAFGACLGIEDYTVNGANPVFCSVDGVLYDQTRGTLVQYPQARGGEYILPASVTNLADGSLAYCRNLERVYFQGNAPHLSWSFEGSSTLTCYFLPDTKGWGATYGGRPTALWLPEAQAEGLGVADGLFGFTLQWAPGRPVVVEACTNLIEAHWIPVATNTPAADGTVAFADAELTNHPGCFYRTQPVP